jgi:N-acetylmuramoyl-L-alanine amidase
MAQSVELAKLVQKRTCATAGRQNKGVKQAGFLVLRETSMPSCLIELGFISTPDEERFLDSESGVEKLGKGIYQAFVDYYTQATKPSRPKGKMARALADVREGRVTDVDDEKAKDEKKVQPKMEEPEPAIELLKEDSVVVAKVEPMPEPTPKPVQEVKPTLVQETKPTPVPETMPTPVQETKPAPKPAPVVAEKKDAPVFKVQILASSTKLKPNNPQLKGQTKADYYQEGGLYKYTLGSSENYNEIYQLRKAQLANFPQAFIIAFKNGQKMNVQEAIQEFKRGKR